MTTTLAVVAPGGLYKFFVLLHVICVVGGFGAIVYRSLVLDLARRRGYAVAAGVLGVFGQVVQVGSPPLYGAGLLGSWPQPRVVARPPSPGPGWAPH